MKNFKVLLFLTLTAVFSCSESDDNIIDLEGKVFNLEDNSDEICDDSRLNDPNYTGVICCTQRNSDFNSNNIVEYEYFTNISNPNILWEVKSGDIKIISENNAEKVTIMIGENFDEGSIFVLGSSDNDNSACGHTIFIKNNI